MIELEFFFHHSVCKNKHFLYFIWRWKCRFFDVFFSSIYRFYGFNGGFFFSARN